MNNYQNLAMRTNDGKAGERLERATKEAAAMGYDLAGLLNGLLGLAGESGELTDMFNQLMVLPNVIALIALSALVVKAAGGDKK